MDEARRGDEILEVLLGLAPLWELERTGWAMRGVQPCESIAEHCFGVALTTMLLVDALRVEGVAIDGERALRMALVHDAPEAATGDIPMPQKTPQLTAALVQLEATLVDKLLPQQHRELWREVEEGTTLEARVVKAADKVQMMARALVYTRYRRGDVSEFWTNPRNFDDRGIGPARDAFQAILRRAGQPRPPDRAQ